MSTTFEYKLRVILGDALTGKRTTVSAPQFTDLVRAKQVGLVYPSFYLRPTDAPPLPQNKLSEVEGEHLRFVGLFDVDMPSDAPPLDPGACTSLRAACAANGAFGNVIARAEAFCARVEGVRAMFTGGKGVLLLDTRLRPELFLKCRNADNHTKAIAEALFPQLYGPAYAETIQPALDDCLYGPNGARTNLFPKQTHRFRSKLLSLGADGAFADVPFDMAEDADLTGTVQAFWTSVAAYLSTSLPPSAFASMPLTTLPTNREMRTRHKKRRPSARAQRYQASADAAKRQRAAATAEHAQLFAFLAATYPVLPASGFRVEECGDDGLKLLHDSSACPMKGGGHRHIRDLAVFVRPNGAYRLSCFHPECKPGRTGTLPRQLVRALFPLNFSTHYQAAKLFATHCLRGRAACLAGNGLGTYMYDEAMGLWAEHDRKAVRNLICEDLPPFLEAHASLDDGSADGACNPRQYEDMGQANQVLDALLPIIADREFANDLDAVPHMLSVQNGLLDLRTLELRPRRMEDKVTFCLSTPWPEEAGLETPTPLIDSFFRQFLGIKDPAATREADREKGVDDEEGVLEFLRCLLGYTCLTGGTNAQVLTFFYGKQAGNAKTAMLKLVSNLMEGYALKCERKLLVKCAASNEGAANPSLMSLQGKRLAYCEEFGEDEKMDDERIKALTGGGEVRARQLNHPEVQFTMTCGFLLASNNKPSFTSLDAAILRRLVMISCDTMYRDDTTAVRYDPAHPKHRWRDSDIVEKLNTPEGKAQLLVWLARGAKRFYDEKMTLPPLPPSVSAFGRRVQQEQDLVGTFVAECCEVDPAFDAAAAAEYMKRGDARYLYLKSDLAHDFKEQHNAEFSSAFESQLRAHHGVVTRRLKVGGYSSGQMYYVGVRPADHGEAADDVLLHAD